ncbi:hypothetical protein [Ornithinimicrobium cerasi]|nr:hypothetical protein [Ornithinimicrobium cerasi]
MDDLVSMNWASGRPPDLADIEALSRLTDRPIVEDDEHPDG